MKVRWHQYLLACSECDVSVTADAAAVMFNARGEVSFSGRCPDCGGELKAKIDMPGIMKLCRDNDEKRSSAKGKKRDNNRKTKKQK